MKKSFFFSLILGLLLTNFSLYVKGQNPDFKKNVEKAFVLYNSRPADVDSTEAINLITGKIKESHQIKKEYTHLKYQGLLEKTNTCTETYYIDSATQRWAFNIYDQKEGEWKTNWFIISFILGIIFAIILIARGYDKRTKFKLPM